MSPVIHFLGSWLVASSIADNSRDRKLITFAGVVPDADGLGIIADVAGSIISDHELTFEYYQRYHHMWLHGWPGAIVVAMLFACFAKNKKQVAMLCLLTFHLHLLCDFLGSRGPTLGDIWPINYGEPLSRLPFFFWRGQWRLDGWQNQIIFLCLLGIEIWRALRTNFSCVEFFSAKADSIFLKVLQGWRKRIFH